MGESLFVILVVITIRQSFSHSSFERDEAAKYVQESQELLSAQKA